MWDCQWPLTAVLCVTYSSYLYRYYCTGLAVTTDWKEPVKMALRRFNATSPDFHSVYSTSATVQQSIFFHIIRHQHGSFQLDALEALDAQE